MLSARFGFGLVVWLFLIIVISINLYIAKKLSPGTGAGTFAGAQGDFAAQIGLSANTLNLFFLAFILLASFVIASKASDKWNLVLRFLYAQPFDSADPIFQKNIGFYVFDLPLFNKLTKPACQFSDDIIFPFTGFLYIDFRLRIFNAPMLRLFGFGNNF